MRGQRCRWQQLEFPTGSHQRLSLVNIVQKKGPSTRRWIETRLRICDLPVGSRLARDTLRKLAPVNLCLDRFDSNFDQTQALEVPSRGGADWTQILVAQAVFFVFVWLDTPRYAQRLVEELLGNGNSMDTKNG